MPSTTDISYRILIVVCIVLHQSISGQRQWLPFGENNMKPLPGMPIASGLDQKDVDAAEFFSPRDNESALAYAPETSRKFLPKCGETRMSFAYFVDVSTRQGWTYLVRFTGKIPRMTLTYGP